MAITIRGLSKLLKTIKVLCKVIQVYGPKIKEHVPSGNQVAYQEALDAVLAACAVLEAIDWIGDGIDTF